MKRISLIIPVYNVEKYLRMCLDSCLKQDLNSSEYEIIIINDGSTDSSIEIIKEFQLNYENIIIASQKNAGLSAARNKGLYLSSGRYVWFIDSDDFIKENCLNSVLKLCEYQELDILGIGAANIINLEANRRFSIDEKYKKDIIDGKYTLLNELWQTCAPFSIYNRKFLLKNNLLFFEGIYHEDSEFTPRSYYLAKKIMLIDDLLYFVNLNPNSITRTVNPKKSFDLIKVCISLNSFLLNVEKDYQKVFSNLISCNLNTSLHNIYFMNKEESKCLNLELRKNHHLFTHLLKSDFIKYKIEWFLFQIFKGKYSQVYKYIQKINRK